MERILIYGTGNMYNKYKKRFKKNEVVALFDSNPEKWGGEIDGLRINCPNQISQIQYDYIVILIYKYIQVKEYLISNGVPENKIVTIDDTEFRDNFRRVSVYNNECKDKSYKKSILLLSHEMNYRGAPLMLYNMAKILVKLNYNVSVACDNYGELGDEYKNIGAQIIVFDDFYLTEKEFNDYMIGYSLIVVNTLAFWKLIPQLEVLDTEILWWLHEEESAYEILKVDMSRINVYDRLNVYGVGKRAIDAFHKYSEERIAIKELLWGIEECTDIPSKLSTGKLVFAIIGPVSYIKGQDFFVKTLYEKGQELIDKIEVLIIGDIDDEKKRNMEKLSCVKCLDEISHTNVLELYSKIDVVLSVSRNDTMSVVIAEGLMNRKMCLVSDIVGVADYIENYENGLIFESENADDLIDKLKWCVDNRDKFEYIQSKGYALYKSVFSFENFERNTKKLLEDLNEKGI